MKELEINNIPEVIDFAGECIGISLTRRGYDEDPDHILINIHIEDDESWSKELSLDSYFIDEFIELLLKTKETLERDYEKSPDGFGYDLKK